MRETFAVAVLRCGCGFVASAMDRERAAVMMFDHVVHVHATSPEAGA